MGVPEGQAPKSTTVQERYTGFVAGGSTGVETKGVSLDGGMVDLLRLNWSVFPF